MISSPVPDSVKEVENSGHSVPTEGRHAPVSEGFERDNTVTRREHTQATNGPKGGSCNEAEVLFNVMIKVSGNLGELGALKSMFSQMGRSGIGTSRSEAISKDLVYQNILKGVDLGLKEQGKENQQRDPKTIRALMKIQEDLMRRNMSRVEGNRDSLITLIIMGRNANETWH